VRLLKAIFAGFGKGNARTPSVAGNAFQLDGFEDLGSFSDVRRDGTLNVAVALVIAFMVFVGAVLVFGSFSKQATVRGYVSASSGAARLKAADEGVVSRVWVKQGERVVEGQKLLTIRQTQASVDGVGALSKSEIKSMEAQRSALKDQRRRLAAIIDRDKIDHLNFETDTDAMATALADEIDELERLSSEQQETVRSYKAYLKDGYATRDSLIAQQRLAVDYQRQLAQLRVDLIRLKSSMTDRRRAIERTSSESRSQSTDIANRIADLDVRVSQLRAGVSYDVLAPTSGIVSTLAVRRGSSVDSSQFVASIAEPDADLRVLLEAPSSAVGLIDVGDRVVLKYDAFPFKTFGIKHGHVVRIGAAPVTPVPRGVSRAPASVAPPTQSSFLIEVEPEEDAIEAYGETRPILAGSTLTADIITERRRLIDWLLDPIRALRGKL